MNLFKEEVKDKIDYWLNEVKIDIFWLIHTKNDEPIGFVSADLIGDCVYGNIGIAIGNKYVNKGYGSEVLKALIEHIKECNGKQIYYSHFKENDASKRLALKYGFKFYSQEKRVRRYDNKEFDELFYVLDL